MNHPQYLRIVRGLPNSNKGLLAMRPLFEGTPFAHYEADMFFLKRDGIYKYTPTEIPSAHRWCQDKTRESLLNGLSVHVSNTFSRVWEMQAYFKLAQQLRIPVIVEEATEEAPPNYDIPEYAIVNMRTRWEWFPIGQFDVHLSNLLTPRVFY